MPGLKSDFPHTDHRGQPTFRSGQKQFLMKLHKCVQSDNINFVIIEAPTGFGKTAVAGTLAKHHGPSYYLTEQKIHQDQLNEEFPSSSVVCKGQRNYNCGEERDDGKCCDPIPNQHCDKKPSTEFEGVFAGESNSRGELHWKPGLADPCPYFLSKTQAMEAPIACLNYPYFFNETYYTEDFGPRNVMICDEAHNVAKNMQQFLTFRIDDFIQDETGLVLEDLGQNVGDWEDWILNDLKNAVHGRFKEVKRKVEYQWQSSDDIDYELVDKQDKLDEILCNINRFGIEYDDDYFGEMDWAVERHHDGSELDYVSFEPVGIAPFADRLLFDYADTVILVSATILDKGPLMRSLGMVRYEEETAFLRYSTSPFDVENRPVIYYDAPSVNHQNWGESFPAVVKLIDNICQKPEHQNEKGLIHSVSYNNENLIRREVSPSVERRLMFHQEDERDDVLERFKKTNKPKILCSPSMYEGVDLKEDLSRFQIIPKVPYLSLGSRSVKLKREQDPRWYDWRTAIRLIQSFGRSVRSRDDYAKTYVVDGSFQQFYKRNKDLFPDYISGENGLDGSIQKGHIQELLEVT